MLSWWCMLEWFGVFVWLNEGSNGFGKRRLWFCGATAMVLRFLNFSPCPPLLCLVMGFSFEQSTSKLRRVVLLLRAPVTSPNKHSEWAIRVLILNARLSCFRNPSDVRESILREMEKERIREEIIAAEIARKQLLEAEVRREMMLEREMALRRAEGFSFFSGSASVSAMLFEPRLSLLGQSEGRLLEERLALSLEERLGYRAPRGIGGFETFPFHRNSEPKISEVKPPPEVSKEKVIFLVLFCS
ncbi:hypothetical protein Acr_00g0060640 [Actinidia rufa]|uniref:Uncharacterized protein n=1 Tax=Actinidia rufa TaxID=165716 RepID=A0A7J0DNF6_9ERIC|nr:hypothetical protein Acr_00g0060640 [Actinidia rufa]